jgi:uncharacterized membrane protein (UPF0127 family)
MIKNILIFLITSLNALQITLQDVPLTVEVAITEESRNKGLSGRKKLPEGSGMLFIFERSQYCHFWMKDTLIPLSIGFFDENKYLMEWKDMPLPGEKKLTLVSSQKPALYALEVPLGWFVRHHIRVGAKLSGF